MTDIEELIAELKAAVADDTPNGMITIDVTKARSILSALESMRWVAVGERLPELYENVLVWGEHCWRANRSPRDV